MHSPHGSMIYRFYTVHILVRPINEYADVVFHNITNTLTEQIDNVQRETLLELPCAYKQTHTILLYDKTGLEYMSGICKQHRLTILYKIKNGQAPIHFQILAPPPAGENRHYHTRYSADTS